MYTSVKSLLRFDTRREDLLNKSLDIFIFFEINAVRCAVDVTICM